MKLHHLGPRQASAFVQIVHVLCDEQKFVGNLRQSGYRFVRGIGSRVAYVGAARDTIAKPGPDRARTLPGSPALSDPDCASNRLFHGMLESHFQPKHRHLSEREHARRKIGQRSGIPSNCCRIFRRPTVNVATRVSALPDSAL
jgi:hypothetical protein